MEFENGVSAAGIPGIARGRSSASVGERNRGERAALSGGPVAVRASRFPDGPALVRTQAETPAFATGATSGAFDFPTDPRRA